MKTPYGRVLATVAIAMTTLAWSPPMMAAEQQIAPSIEDQDNVLAPRLTVGEPRKKLMLNTQTDDPDAGPYLQEWRAREELGGSWAPSSVHDEMRDGAAPPWHRTLWGN